MARNLKTPEVQKFGGNDHIGSTKFNGYDHEVESVESQSRTNLEQDHGVGNAAVIRMFEFSANPETFQHHLPTKQELFNAHYKGIELALWKDGLKVIPTVNPQIAVGKKRYRIWVGAAPMRGQTLSERPQTLSDIVHG